MIKRLPVFALLSLVFVAGAAEETHQFTFAWPFAPEGEMAPRGGSTTGPEVNLVEQTREAFKRIHAPGLSKRERDRRAILALAGDYRVSFDFLEILGFTPDYAPPPPYQSWATERIYVIANEPGFISLQHILVTRVVADNGEIKGPFVVKHWRQDWRYQPEDALRYQGNSTWSEVPIPDPVEDGYWVQSVWHVADAPRYAGWGHWLHQPNYSVWVSNTTPQPLPRREKSVRDDYGLLVGTNRITVLPTGWVQEETNMKVALADQNSQRRAIAREYGISRYQAIKSYNFAAGDDYWQATKTFWHQVRAYWDQVIAERQRLHLRVPEGQPPLFKPLFQRAYAIAEGETFTKKENRSYIAETIDSYVAPPQ